MIVQSFLGLLFAFKKIIAYVLLDSFAQQLNKESHHARAEIKI